MNIIEFLIIKAFSGNKYLITKKSSPKINKWLCIFYIMRKQGNNGGFLRC